jgi:hypothetical protein
MQRGSDIGFLLDTPTRVKLDLSGEWHFVLSENDIGRVQIPSAFDFTGKVTFDRTFEVPAELVDNYRLHLVMLGANYSTDVYLNGDFVVNHTGGYTSFVQPLPPGVPQVGTENKIQVVVSNVLDPRTTVPVRPGVWGWRNYGGITRDIYILGTPRLYIKDAVLHTEYPDAKGGAKVRVTASVEGEWTLRTEGKERETLGFFFQVLDRISGESVGQSPVVGLAPAEEGWKTVEGELTLPVPKIWAPKNPELYLLKCYLVVTAGKESKTIDEYDLDCGIRSVAIVNGDFLVNGKRLVLNGVNWYEENQASGSALSYEEMERDVAMIKNLGANAIRFIGHPPHPFMLNLCDRYGLFALIDLPLFRLPAAIVGQEAFAEHAQGMLREMILRDRTHPSVLAWGLGSELESTAPAMREFVGLLNGLAKSLDDRPTYLATVFLEGDTCADLVDIAALNLNVRDPKEFQSALEKWRKLHKSRPVILTQCGTQVEESNRNGYSDPHSQEAQARYFLQRLEMIRAADFDGRFVWSFNDWKGDRPSLTIVAGNPWIHATGLVSGTRDKRIAYDAVRSVYQAEKFAALPMGSYSPGAPLVYVLAGFVVLIIVAYVYNANRRFRENLNRSVLSSFNFFSDIRDQHLVPVLHSLFLGAVVSIASAIVVSSIAYHFRDSMFLDILLSYVLVDDRVKEAVVQLVWDPVRCIAVASVLVFVKLAVISGVIYFLRIVLKTRIYFYHAYSVTVWSTAPLLILIPVGMILYRVMEGSFYIIPSLVLIALLMFWVCLRMLKGTAIIYDIVPAKVYAAGFAVLVVLVAALYLYFDATGSLPLYLPFFAKLTSVMS